MVFLFGQFKGISAPFAEEDMVLEFYLDNL